MLPLLVTLALAIGHVLAAGVAHELAGHAAEAGAIAALRGADPREAVRAAVPEWARDRMDVDVEGRRVRVRLEPLAAIPGAASRLASTAVADAGSPGTAARRVLEGLEGQVQGVRGGDGASSAADAARRAAGATGSGGNRTDRGDSVRPGRDDPAADSAAGRRREAPHR